MNAFTNVKDQHVTYETAKALKDKGFNEPVDRIIWVSGDNKDTDTVAILEKMRNSDLDRDDIFSCPTHQMVLSWLRETYHLFIEVSLGMSLGGVYCFDYSVLDSNCKYISKAFTGTTYEDATEKAIQDCLANFCE